MKKIIYVFLLAIVSTSVGCDKDEIITEEQSKNEKFSVFQKNGFTDENGNPTEVYHLYLDMDYLEANYTGSYTGSFSQHFYNEMSAHFTIHSVEYASSNCGNIERWTVDKQEYDLYVYLNGPIFNVIVVNPDNDNGGNNSSTSNGDNSSSGDDGWGDENGNVTQKPQKPKPINNDDEPQSTPAQYEGCF